MKMCGIAGIFTNQAKSVDQNTLTKMGNAIQHRGTDDSGTFIGANGRIGLVHRRLAIQDLSPLGRQPMLSASGRYVTVFNGEIYNFVGLRNDLKKQGYHFKSESDTEVLVNGFEHWGVLNTIERCVGMFAIAIYDQRVQKLSLFRDRMGEKPLYYSRCNNNLLFASELSCFEAVGWFNKSIDKNALALLFRHNFIPAPHSIYENTYKLLPGHYIEIDLNRPEIECEPKAYWSIESQVNYQELSFGEASEHTEFLLRQSIEGQMISDAPLGAFLSGGIDSSLICALMQQQSSNKINTFSIGFTDPAYNEAEYAKEIAQHLGTEHTELYVTGKDAVDVVENLPQIYSEPFADSSQIPTYLLAKMAREKVTVALSGDGGDELFCGYQRYFDYVKRLHRANAPISEIKRLIFSLPMPLQKSIARIFNTNARHLTPSSLENKLANEKQLYSLADRPQAFYQHAISYTNRAEPLIPGASYPPYLLSEGLSNTKQSDVHKQYMLLDAQCYLPDDILVEVDRAAMANSLETRVPMLDHRVVEFALGLNTSLNIKGDVGKQVLRDIAFKYIPKELLERPKRGFAVPKSHWLRNELKPMASDLLHPDLIKRQGILDADIVKDLWQSHVSGRSDKSMQLWGILMFQQWMQSHT